MTKGQDKFIMFCKTYFKEIKAFDNMLESFNRFNKDNIGLYISVPKSEINLYKKYQSKIIKVIDDESYAGAYFTSNKYWGLPEGYIDQEICKLSFWETGKAENYLCIDSDLYFIRSFYVKDFMFNETVPYSVLVMDKDLHTEHFYRDFGKWRMGLIKKIFDEVAYDDSRHRTCHGMQVLNSKVLEDFKTNFMMKKKYNYQDLIKISPYEFTWYNVWLQKSQVIPVKAVEPFFKTFHTRIEYIFSRLKKIKESDLAEQYVGIVLNSNWKKKLHQKYQNPGFIEKLFYKIVNLL